MLIRNLGVVVLSLALVLSANAAAARSVTATPDTLAAVFAGAKGGDAIVLRAGDYSEVKLAKKTFSPALVIDASAATMADWFISDVSGLTLKGGAFRISPPKPSRRDGSLVHGKTLQLARVNNIAVTGMSFTGPGNNAPGEGFVHGAGYGVYVTGGHDVEISDARFVGLKVGLVVARVDGFRVQRNSFIGMRSDGVNAAESRNGLIEGNLCQGTHISGGEHPDCIQLWSRPTSPPTADVVIRKNRIEGATQGIGLYNHVRNGVNDGGFDRILIEENDITVAYPNAISMWGSRDSIVRNNRMKTAKDGKHQAMARVDKTAMRCGNVAGPGGGRPGVTDDRCPRK